MLYVFALQSKVILQRTQRELKNDSLTTRQKVKNLYKLLLVK